MESCADDNNQAGAHEKEAATREDGQKVDTEEVVEEHKPVKEAIKKQLNDQCNQTLETTKLSQLDDKQDGMDNESDGQKQVNLQTAMTKTKQNSSDLSNLHDLCMELAKINLANKQDANRKTSDSILGSLVTEDLSSIRDTKILKTFFIEYLHQLPPKVISEILSVLIAIVKKSVFHLESTRGLLLSCIDYLMSSDLNLSRSKVLDQTATRDDNQNNTSNSKDDDDATENSSNISLTKHFLREWINLLIAHSCDVEELKFILKLSEQDPNLLSFIQQASSKQKNRPHAFFAFPGTKGSIMSLPPFQKWPIQLGWSFSTWFFLEPKSCAQPYLYNFKTGVSGIGYSAHFTGNCLVLTSIRVKGKGVQHCVAYEFPPYKWIHCAITYHNKWRASEIKVYVNGQLTANIEMPWQVQTTEMFDKCFIGGSGSITHNDRSGDLNCFCGQMSAIYLFNEGLSPTQICALHRLGPSYMGQFKYSNESHVNLPPQISKTLYEEKLAPTVFCLFTPVAVDSGTLCIQLAPLKSSTSASAQNYFVSAPHAALLGETRAIITQPICSTLQSLGCSRSLLPLLNVFASKGNPDACSSLIGFLCDLLESSPHWFANEIVQNNGFVVVACSLASNASLLLSEKLLNIFLNLTRILLTTSTTPSDSLLLKHLMDNILFNPSLWIYADTKLQIKLYCYLATEFLHGTRHNSNLYKVGNNPPTPYVAYTPTSSASAMYNHNINSGDEQSRAGPVEQSPMVADVLFGEIRRVSTVLQSFHALKYYYWMVEEKNIIHKARNHRLRPSQSDLAIIRMHILSFTKELIVRSNTTPLDEVQGILNYLSACSEPENILDVLETLSTLIVEHPSSMISAIDQKQGIRVLFMLIGSSSEQVRIASIRLLCRFLAQCSHKKKHDIMGPNNLFMLLFDRLRIYRPLTLPVYETLIDLMVEGNDPERAVDDKRSKDISKKRIENSMIIKVIASLLHEELLDDIKLNSSNEPQEKENYSKAVDIRKLFINDLWNLMVNSRDNRRIILQMSVWQHWLINLIDSTLEDSQLVRDQILAIFRVLLYHAIRYEYGGWRVWIDTLAIIHAKVSFDEFRQRLCQDLTCESSDVKKQDEQVVSRGANETKDTTVQIDSKRDEMKVDESKQVMVSSISEHVLNESRGIEMKEDQGGVDEPDKDPGEGFNGVEESKDKSTEPTETSESKEEDEENVQDSALGMDSTDIAPSRAYRRTSQSEELEQVTDTAATTGVELVRQPSLTSIPLEDSAHSETTAEPETISRGDEELAPKDEQVEMNHVAVGSNNNHSSGPQSIQSHKAAASPAFRIPEFKWGNILVKLLNDLMFSIECDLYHWRCLANLTSLDTPPFVTKLSPNSTASNQNTTNASNTRGTSAASSQIESVLQKSENQIYIINVVHLISQLADNVIIAAGGLLPLLADATGGNRATSADGNKSVCEGLTMAQANSLLYRLVNMVDMVIFAASHVSLNELEADKNTTSGGILRQCLRLVCTVTVKNCLVLRSLSNKMDLSGQFDITNIGFPKGLFDSYQGCSLLSANGLFDQSALTLENTDLIANLEYSPHQTPNVSSMPSLLPFQTSPVKDPNKLLQSIDISRIQACIYHNNSTESRQSQFLALSSLYFISVLMVSKYRDIIEPKHKSTDKSKSGSSPSQSGSDSSPVASESGAQNSPSQPAAVSSIEANLLNFGKMQPNNPAPTSSALTNLLTTKLESTLDTVCPLLKSIMCDFCAFLSRTLIGSHGQDLVNKEAERTFRRQNSNSVELVMLLCSQEWQNTLQKNAGLAFIELINEGRVLSHGMKDHIVRVAMEAEFILSRLRADDVAKHEQFGLACSESLSARLHEEVLINSLISSAARRDYVMYCRFREVVQNESKRNYKLDIWEDDDRRKRRFVFDSWDDRHQSFYSSQQDSKSSLEVAPSSQGDKTNTKRILELQKTIEMGGIDEHCSQAGADPGTISDPQDILQAKDEDSDEANYEEDDEENVAQHHYRDSTSPNSDDEQRKDVETTGEHLADRLKLHDSAYHKTSGGKGTTTTANLDSELVESRSGNQIWDYEDYGSVNDFTGSVIFAAECSLIWSIYAIPGVLQITTHELYFEPNQNISESIDMLKRDLQADNQADTSLSSQRSNQNESLSSGEQINLRKIDLRALRYCDFLTCNGKMLLSDIRAIFSRHYLLQPNALEIFMSQRTSVMFAFNDFDIVKRVVKYLPPVGVGIKYGIPQSRRASLMSARQLFAASNMTQKWQKREIGNFQYLMFLNTIAGRTYQDLNQYPVFPWILTNYESEELDLNLPTNFRDLSKPVGALNNKRRAEFIERYQSWDNPKVLAFHYGTHYSTAAFTLNWLCRLRGAYNSSYLAIQDGRYEEDSRLFLSIGDSWVSSLIGGQQNVKELIPEFFYLPEMFHANLGLPEVEFPPWAKSAEQFVRMHRIALESELVSCQLHQWVDLIFGYKQRGPEAINAVNTFYYLTYQGNVNLSMIQDATLRDAIETQIKHFGQTPSQLTTEPHPPRFSALHASPLMFSSSVDETNKVIKFPFNNPVVHISSCINNYITASNAANASISDDSASIGTVQNPGNSCPSSVLTITSNNQYQIHKWMPNDQTGHPFTIDPQLESQGGNSTRRQLIDVDDLCSGISLKFTNYSKGSDDDDSNMIEEVQWPCAHHIVTLNGKYIIMGSFYDNSFRVFTTESGKLCQVIYGHREPITCIARSEGNAAADFFVATGSQDCSLLIWTWNERYAQIEGSGVSAVHNPLPKLSISGHHTPVLSAMICAELGLIISGSKNLILVHTTTSGENLLQIDVKLPEMMDRTLCESQVLSQSQSCSKIQRPQMKDKQRTILEASMLGEDTRELRTKNKDGAEGKSGPGPTGGQTLEMASNSAKDERFSQLKDLCCSDYYVTNLQIARELAFIVCIALPPPRSRSSSPKSKSSSVTGGKSSPALLLAFNLKGSLMDSTPIGQSANGPKLGDVCALQVSRDGEHLVVNDSPISVKIYRTFGLQPIYAYNTNDISNTLSEDQNRIKSLALLDQKYILVGLENGKIIVYNSDFKNLH